MGGLAPRELRETIQDVCAEEFCGPNSSIPYASYDISQVYKMGTDVWLIGMSFCSASIHTHGGNDSHTWRCPDPYGRYSVGAKQSSLRKSGTPREHLICTCHDDRQCSRPQGRPTQRSMKRLSQPDSDLKWILTTSAGTGNHRFRLILLLAAVWRSIQKRALEQAASVSILKRQMVMLKFITPTEEEEVAEGLEDTPGW